MTALGVFSFPKHFHLLRPAEFSRVYEHGRKSHSRGFVLFQAPNEEDHPRLGLSIGRKFGGAVRRNRIKRLVRETFRLHWREWDLQGRDIIVIAKKRADTFCYDDVTLDMKKTLHRPRTGRR